MRISTPILVTGASGFVGANLLRKLICEVSPKKIHIVLRRRFNAWRIGDLLRKVVVHTVDLENDRAVRALIRQVKPKTVFHLATYGVHHFQSDENKIVKTNIIGTFNLLQACLESGFDAFINTGSSAEYGAVTGKMKEDDTFHPLTAYGASKTWGVMYGEYLARAQKAPIVALRPFSMYGFYDFGRLIPNIILALMRGERPKLAAPNIARDFIFIEDVIGAYLKAAQNPFAGEVFNIGSGKATAIKEIFELISAAMRVNVLPVWDKNVGRLSDSGQVVADVGLAKKELDWRPKTDVRQGIEKTTQWFKKNFPLYKNLTNPH